jgi:hypothetical protein
MDDMGRLRINIEIENPAASGARIDAVRKTLTDVGPAPAAVGAA